MALGEMIKRLPALFYYAEVLNGVTFSSIT